MKFLKILAVIMATGIVACDPLEDEINALDKTSTITADIEITLTDDDYDGLEDLVSAQDTVVAQSIGRNKNFSTDDDAKKFVPMILTANYPALGDGSSAIVSYDFFNGSSPRLTTGTEFTVTDQEYEDLGFSFGNFGNLSRDLATYAEFKVSDPSNGDYLDITHAFFSSATGFVPDTLSRVVYTVAYGWMWAQPLPDDSYLDFFGESPPDFSFSDEGEEKIPFYLKETVIFVEEGDRALIQYNYDNGEDVNPTSLDVALFIYEGGQWLLYGDSFQVTTQTLSFGHDGTTWVPDNTIKYTLTGADFTAIATATAISNPAGSGSAGQFGNFDVGLWSEEQIIDAVGTQLLTVFPGAAEGQKYLVSYATWEPGAGVREIHLILEGGVYVKFEG